MENIMILAAAAGAVAKIFIDVARMAYAMPKWLPPSMALVLSPLLVFLFLLSTTPSLTVTWQLIATCVLAGIVAAGYSVGATELARRGDVTARSGDGQ